MSFIFCSQSKSVNHYAEVTTPRVNRLRLSPFTDRSRHNLMSIIE